jgi:hypothetical protein
VLAHGALALNTADVFFLNVVKFDSQQIAV